MLPAADQAFFEAYLNEACTVQMSAFIEETLQCAASPVLMPSRFRRGRAIRRLIPTNVAKPIGFTLDLPKDLVCWRTPAPHS